jgi:hypothetical protein
LERKRSTFANHVDQGRQRVVTEARKQEGNKARTHLALQGFDKVTNRHPTGNGVRVDDDVGRDALARERHVLLSVVDAHRALLPVTRRKLVSDFRNTNRAHSDLSESIAVGINCHHDLVYDPTLRRARERRRVTLRVSHNLGPRLLSVLGQPNLQCHQVCVRVC